MRETDRSASLLTATAQGAIAAMAMTGMRSLTRELGLVVRTPPEELAAEGVPGLLARVPHERRRAAIEVAHWSYGAFAGAVFGALPASVRQSMWGGPVYGLAIWALFEVALAPVFAQPKERRIAERAAIATDHLLYGLIVTRRHR